MLRRCRSRPVLLRHLESSSQMRQLVRRPLYLMIFCFAAEHGERVLPENEGQLLETSLRAMLQQRALPQEVCLKLLGRFAWDCWGNTRGRLTEAQAIGAIIETRKRDAIVADAPLPQHAEQVLSLIAEASGVLVRLNHSYAFATEIFIEYLVGRYLAELSITQDEVLREQLTSMPGILVGLACSCSRWGGYGRKDENWRGASYSG